MSGRKLARRACDGCKIRKVKCSETTPCDGCRNANIPCTWLKQAQPRGPRRLRDATLQEIRKAQDILQSQSREATRRTKSRSTNVNDPDPPPQPSSEIAQLVLYLCLYRVQLFPIWPIIKVERLIASLQSEPPDVEVFALAYALAAATATRTQSTDLSISRRDHAHILENRCQAARAKVPAGRPANLNTVRIAFFLHVYYDSLEPNSMKSMLYLREAVTIATMIGLHKESYYLEVPEQEREIRRRVLWLLFITERVIAVLYEQPITLRTRIELPSTKDTDEVNVLAGFQLLAKLFWRLDDADMFAVLDELDVQASPTSNGVSSTPNPPRNYRDLICSDDYHGYIPPVQVLDLAVTRAWLQVINLRILQVASTSSAPDLLNCLLSLLPVVEDAVEVVERSSQQQTDALGAGVQLKLLTVSGVVQDSLPNFLMATSHAESSRRQDCLDVSNRLGHLFATKFNDNKVSQSFSSPLSFRHISPHAISPAPSEGAASENPGRSHHLSAVGTGARYLHQDFAKSNDYEDLFDAVQSAVTQSSDSVEDLFGETSLDHYQPFDESRPDLQGMDHMNPYLWQHWHQPI